jgi:hypothetical protein
MRAGESRGCEAPCDTFVWSDFGACAYSGSCENTGTRTRTKTAPMRCGGNQSETVVWDDQRATLDKPRCSAGQWETITDAPCEHPDYRCGSHGGFKQHKQFVTNETTCDVPEPIKTTCVLPACNPSDPLTGYYKKESGMCPPEHEIQTREDCMNAVSGYERFQSTDLGPFIARCALSGNLLYYNTVAGQIVGNDANYKALCKGTPLPEYDPISDGNYEIRVGEAQCPEGKELNESECHSDAVKRLILQVSGHIDPNKTLTELSSSCLGCNFGCSIVAKHWLRYNTYPGPERPVYTSNLLLCKK